MTEEGSIAETADDPPGLDGPGAAGAWPGQLGPALRGVAWLGLLTGVAYPAVLGLLAWGAFPRQAGGGLVRRDGVVVGAARIGQGFDGPGYFHPRPSAAGAGPGYDGAASGGTNLGPSHPKLIDEVRGLAERYRRVNGLSADAPVPADAPTRSASGLDPDISPANAALQVPRVARARGLSEESVRRLVDGQTTGRALGLFGEPTVAVLPLNLALDRLDASR